MVASTELLMVAVTVEQMADMMVKYSVYRTVEMKAHYLVEPRAVH